MWKEVTKRNPCPICKDVQWCEVHQDGNVHCMKVPSTREMTCRMGGWVHGTTPHMPPPFQKRRTPAATLLDAAAWWEAHREATTLAQLEPWATSLSLSLDILSTLGACVDGDVLCFPMHDGIGKVCGIRTRFKDGSKKCVSGSRNGLFLPTIHIEGEPLITEGPTDAGAAMALGFEPIGRPQCSGCEDAVIHTCRRLGYKKVTICADVESHGAGMKGAQSLARALIGYGIGCRIVTAYGYKDLRQAYMQGVSRRTLDDAWSMTQWQ